ncbi:hypothetical protein N7G274_007258 [Stereocaulon virgatum]|uniref:Uncharacterized protein n=1 Tax=Stereocaulon virgatum TaxID=373712 RepID=A0ABR4A639_9LECA
MATPLHSTRLASRVTIITGSSSGLGRAIALAFAANGASPIICSDIRPDPRGTWGVAEADVPTHELICQRYGEGKAVYVKADVTVAQDMEMLVHRAVEEGGRLDVMINNAGTGGTESAGKIHEMAEETWDFVMKINARSVFLGCKYAIAQFLSQHVHPSGHRGWIINTASMLGLVGLKPSAGAYCASKGAVVLLTKQIAVEYGIDKIHCNALCPGYLKTPMTAPIFEDKEVRDSINALTPWGEWGLAEDVAKCAVFLASDDAAYVTGLPMTIDGGYTAQ